MAMTLHVFVIILFSIAPLLYLVEIINLIYSLYSEENGASFKEADFIRTDPDTSYLSQGIFSEA